MLPYENPHDTAPLPELVLEAGGSSIGSRGRSRGGSGGQGIGGGGSSGGGGDEGVGGSAVSGAASINRRPGGGNSGPIVNGGDNGSGRVVMERGSQGRGRRGRGRGAGGDASAAPPPPPPPPPPLELVAFADGPWALPCGGLDWTALEQLRIAAFARRHGAPKDTEREAARRGQALSAASEAVAFTALRDAAVGQHPTPEF